MYVVPVWSLCAVVCICMQCVVYDGVFVRSHAVVCW